MDTRKRKSRKGLWLLLLIVNFTEFRNTWEMVPRTCLQRIILIILIDVGRLVLVVGGAVPWTEDPGLYKTEKVRQALGCTHLCFLMVDVMWLAALTSLPLITCTFEVWARTNPICLDKLLWKSIFITATGKESMPGTRFILTRFALTPGRKSYHLGWKNKKTWVGIWQPGKCWGAGGRSLRRWHCLVQSGVSEVTLCHWFWECQKTIRYTQLPLTEWRTVVGLPWRSSFFMLYLRTASLYHTLLIQLIKLAEEEDGLQVWGIRFPKQNLEKKWD